MSRDIFAQIPVSQPRSTDDVFSSLISARNRNSTQWVPRDPEMQKLTDARIAELDIERAREEAEMDTPENRQKAAEAEVAERERKRIQFHFSRALPTYMLEGWKHIREEFTDQEIRVYTEDSGLRRFWGIKPAGIGMDEFWERTDPEIRRYDDRIAITWEDPLIPPPVTAYDERIALIWAGQGRNPDLITPEPPVTKEPTRPKVAAKPKRRPKAPDVNPTHRVRKSTTESSKVNKNTRKFLADNAALIASGAQQGPATEDVDSATSKRPRGRPAVKATTPVAKDDISSTPKRPRRRPVVKVTPAAEEEILSTPKRPRGRPAANPKPTAKDQDELPSKRPRGRPPAKGNPTKRERPSKQKKAPAVQGNARIAKPQQPQRRPLAPSTHKMRTRREGPAELLQLP